MKRILQFVAVTVILLLASQPVMASLDCAAAPCLPGCPMHGTAMAADCAMSMGTTAAACLQTCCERALLEAVVALSAPVMIRPIVLPGPGDLLRDVSLPYGVRGASFQANALFASPPLHILYQVFRI